MKPEGDKGVEACACIARLPGDPPKGHQEQMSEDLKERAGHGARPPTGYCVVDSVVGARSGGPLP